MATKKSSSLSKKVKKTKLLKTTKTDLLKYYRDMLLIRRFEEKAGQLYGMGLRAIAIMVICSLAEWSLAALWQN